MKKLLNKKFTQCDEYGNCWETTVKDQFWLVLALALVLFTIVPILIFGS